MNDDDDGDDDDDDDDDDVDDDDEYPLVMTHTLLLKMSRFTDYLSSGVIKRGWPENPRTE